MGTRIIGLGLGSSLLAWALWVLTGAPPEVTRAKALLTDLANPYRWCDVAEQYVEAGDTAQAQRCFRKALDLGPKLPQIWMRVANFHVGQNEPEEVLLHVTPVLETVSDYDAVVFSYLDALDLPPARVMQSIGNSRRAALSYFRHLLARGDPKDAGIVWPVLDKLGYCDDPTAGAYLSFLLSSGQTEDAARVWAEHLRGRRGDYLRPNRLSNGDFARQPANVPLDWKIDPHPAVKTALEPDAGLHLIFQGTENVAYRNTSQVAVVVPGRYVLMARMRTENITTNEGVHLHIIGKGLDVTTEPLTGTHGWTLVESHFQAPPGTTTVTIAVCRDPSRKFDNKINGNAWIRAVSLVRETGS